MSPNKEKPNIAIDTQYDSRSDVTTHSILHITEIDTAHRKTERTDVIYKWPFNGRHYLTPDDIQFLNKQALRLLNKGEKK